MPAKVPAKKEPEALTFTVTVEGFEEMLVRFVGLLAKSVADSIKRKLSRKS